MENSLIRIVFIQIKSKKQNIITDWWVFLDSVSYDTWVSVSEVDGDVEDPPSTDRPWKVSTLNISNTNNPKMKRSRSSNYVFMTVIKLACKVTVNVCSQVNTICMGDLAKTGGCYFIKP